MVDNTTNKNFEINSELSDEVEKSLRKILKDDELAKREKALLEKERRLQKKEEDYQNKKKEFNPDEISKWKRTYESSKVKPLNVEEVYKWGERILACKNFVTIKDTEELWIYNGEYYIPFGEITLKEICARTDARTCDPGVLRRLTMKITGETYVSRKKFVSPEGLVNLKNGVFSLDSEELLDHSPEYYFKGVLNGPYDKDAMCPTWERDIKNMIKDDESRIKFQKWYGYHFMEENIEQKALIIVGQSRAGKGKKLKVLREFIGPDNVTNFELQDLANPSTYSLGRLFGKRANIISDMGTYPIKDDSIIKNVISGDPVNARNIREAPFELENHAKFTCACNKTPYVRNSILQTHEFQRRFMFVEAVVGYDKEDPHIYEKYLEELYSGGIFNWVLEGYRMYKKEGFKEEDDTLWKKHMDRRYGSDVELDDSDILYGMSLGVY